MTDVHSLSLLGYPALLERIARLTDSVPGREEVLRFDPLPDPTDRTLRSGRIEEIRRLESMDRSLRLRPFFDLADGFDRLRPEGGLLAPKEIRRFLPVFENAAAVHKALDGVEPGGATRLADLAEGITPQPALRKRIREAIDPDGSLLDTASDELSRLRRRRRTLENRIERALTGILRRPENRKWTQEDFVTQRAGRWVIPVRRDAGSQLPGLVHDVSNSGETVFIEPMETVPLGNELRALEAAERAEEERILREICHGLRERLEEIEKTYRLLARMDALIAAARYADRFGMTVAEIGRERAFRIRGGRHPLLWEARLENGSDDPPVAIDLELGGGPLRGMVVTGPNAGGKTVALITGGLLCLMAHAGLPVPASEGTSFPFFRRVAADIGDAQSIEQNLSTFSAHMKRVSELLSVAGPETLLLFDELGSGTDPEEGGALACAILSAAVEKGSYVLASTHLGSVKGFVHGSPQLVNAAVRFDEETLSPLYIVDVGVPGRSHALVVAGRYGIPDAIIGDARRRTSDAAGRLEPLLAELESLRQQADTDRERASGARAEAEKIQGQLAGELSEIGRRRREMLGEAHREARGLIREVRRKAAALLRRIRSSSPPQVSPDTGVRPDAHVQETFRALSRDLEEQRQRLHDEEAQEAGSAAGSLDPATLRPGLRVKVRSLASEGELLQVHPAGGRCRVRVGSMEIEVDLAELAASCIPVSGEPAARVRFEGGDGPVRTELNLIGKRVDPALDELDRFLDRAALAGLGQVRIIHGFGTGALGGGVRGFLKDHVHCRSFRAGTPAEGGDGATVVALKTEP